MTENVANFKESRKKKKTGKSFRFLSYEPLLRKSLFFRTEYSPVITNSSSQLSQEMKVLSVILQQIFVSD
ncbi:2782_t:CDS:2 [Ambispora leptoticha]|uniref:2782_t:CDS:1 n=1 Tax=Ambispora leptoticha TaxID=144679 RepID=A0A9N9ACU1_9GLOM|nr:2782_t:CDS:2 [Ambispora leptoticha]